MREGWEIRKLGEVVTAINGLWVGKKPPFVNIAVIRNTNFTKDCRLDITDIAYIDAEVKHFSTRKLQCGDIIIEKSGGSDKQPVGRPVIFNIPDGDYSFSNFTSTLRIINQTEILPAFLHKVLFAIYRSGKTASMQSKTTGIRNLDFKSYLKLPIPVPPIAEQQRIVAELDLLSGAIEKQKRQLKELDALAQAIFYDMFGDPISNEKGWEVKEISSLFDVGSSKRVFESQWRNEGVPFYRAREIVRLAKGETIEDPLFIEETMFQDYSKKYGVPKPGDMMITAVGTLGVCYIVQKDDSFYFKDGNILWFKQKGLCETRFIKEQYSTDFIKNQIRGNANGATVGTYTITNANKTKVIVPPLSLQTAFAHKIEAIERQKDLIKKSIAETETLFASRMDYWFN